MFTLDTGIKNNRKLRKALCLEDIRKWDTFLYLKTDILTNYKWTDIYVHDTKWNALIRIWITNSVKLVQVEKEKFIR